MIPVNVLSEPTLAVSEGHRPANSRPADPTREYEPGSGASHDHAPVHRPYLARPPPRRPDPRAHALAADYRLPGNRVKGACGVAARALRSCDPAGPAAISAHRPA